MLKDKTIGVVIPAYNENGLIAKVLTTMSDFVDYMITVNDGSTDDTLEVLRSLAAAHPGRVKVSQLERNSGKAEAVRKGLLIAIVNKYFVTATLIIKT